MAASRIVKAYRTIMRSMLKHARHEKENADDSAAARGSAIYIKHQYNSIGLLMAALSVWPYGMPW